MIKSSEPFFSAILNFEITGNNISFQKSHVRFHGKTFVFKKYNAQKRQYRIVCYIRLRHSGDLSLAHKKSQISHD